LGRHPDTKKRIFPEALGMSGGFAILIYALIVALWVAALAFSIWVNRQEKDVVTEGQPAASV